MLSTQQSHTRDVDFHIQAACTAYCANIRILCDKTVSLQHHLRYFDAVVRPVARHAAGHRKIFKEDLHKLDVTFRRLLRSVVGPPGGMDWTRPWHEILHVWNGRVHEQTRPCDVETWSKKCLKAHWKFAAYVALLPDDRWVVRALHWVPAATFRRVGRPPSAWHCSIEGFCRWRRLGDWFTAARNRHQWMLLMDEYANFAMQS